MTARIYTRVSSGRQADGASLETQLAACRAYCLANGLPIAAEYLDILSGTRDDRPAYQAMRAAMEPGDLIILWRMDRIGRRKSELFRFFEECKTRRVGIVSVTQPEMSSELARDLLSVLAAYESQQIAERVMPNMRARAMEGRWVSRAPRWMQIGPDGHLMPAEDAHEAQAAFDLFVATRNLKATATAYGVGTKTMTRTIRSRVYIGEAAWAGVVAPGAHPAIVKQETWEAANAILDGRLRGKRRPRPDSALLTGFIFVGGTDRRMYRQPDIRRDNHRYATRDDGFNGARYSVRCDEADAWVVDQLAGLSLTKADRAAIVREVRERAKGDPHKGARARLTKHRASLERERDGTAAMLARGQIDRPRFERMDARQRRDLADVDAALAALPALPDPQRAAEMATMRIGLDRLVRDAWRDGDVRALRVLLDAFVERVEVFSEPTEGKIGMARGYWRKHPPRYSIRWIDGG